MDSLMMDGVARAIKKLNKPWKKKKLNRKPHPAKVVTFCNVLRIMTNRTYDGIESYVKCMSEKIKNLFHVSRVPGSSVISTGKLEIFLRAQEFTIPAYIEVWINLVWSI